MKSSKLLHLVLVCVIIENSQYEILQVASLQDSILFDKIENSNYEIL